MLPTPVLFTNWGPQTDWAHTEADGTPTGIGELVRRAKLMECKTLAVRISSTSVAQRKWLKAAGFTIAGWENLNQYRYQDVSTEALDAVMPQVEAPPERDAALSALTAGWGKSLPLYLVSTYGGLENGEYAKFMEKGVQGCFVECYAADGHPHEDLNVMENQGVWYKIPIAHLVMTVGTYRNETPANYVGLDKRGDRIGIYLAEPMVVDDVMKQWGALPTITPPGTLPTPPATVDPKAVNGQIVTDAQLWLSQYSDPKTLSRLRVISRIAANGVIPDDPKWVACRDKIVQALNEAGIP